MKFYDLKRRKQISLFATSGNGNNAKKADANINPETANSIDPSDNLICVLGATSVTTAAKPAPKYFNKRKNCSIKNGISSIVLDGNGRYSSSPPPQLSSLLTANSLSSGASSSSDSESGKNISKHMSCCYVVHVAFGDYTHFYLSMYLV